MPEELLAPASAASLTQSAPFKLGLEHFTHTSLDQQVSAKLSGLLSLVHGKDAQYQQYFQRQMERYLNSTNSVPVTEHLRALSEIQQICAKQPSLELGTVLALYQAVSGGAAGPSLGLEQKAEKILQMQAVLGQNYGIQGARWCSIPPEYLLSTYENHFKPDKKGLTLVMVSSEAGDTQSTDMVGIGLFGILRPSLPASDVIVCVAHDDSEVGRRVLGRGTLTEVPDAQKEGTYSDAFVVSHARAEGLLIGQLPDSYSREQFGSMYPSIDSKVFDPGDYMKSPATRTRAWSGMFSPDAGIYLIACSAGGTASTPVPHIESFGNVARFLAALSDRPVHASVIPMYPTAKVTRRPDGHYALSFVKDGIERIAVFTAPHLEYFPLKNEMLMADNGPAETGPVQSIEQEYSKIKSAISDLLARRNFGLHVSKNGIARAYASSRSREILFCDSQGGVLSSEPVKSEGGILTLPAGLPDGVYRLVFEPKNPSNKTSVLDFAVIDGKFYVGGKKK